MYKRILKPILFSFDPESVHNFFIKTGNIMGRFWTMRYFIHLIYNYKGKDISRIIDGLKFRTPFMLSAGFDCNADLMRILPNIGLAGEEIGSVTARPCKGNAKPRLTRLPRSGSILVNKGLKNIGVDKVIEKIKRYYRDNKRDDFVIGISIARTNDSESVPIEKGIEDYAYSFKRLNEENIGYYYTLNISCPNAYGGEAFTDPVLLNRLLSVISSIPCRKPVYIKMPINLGWGEFDALLTLIDKFKFIRGVIIGNLNKNYNYLEHNIEAPERYCGGLSGKPCRDISTELIRKTRAKYGNRFTIFGCGGVMDTESAREKLDAGADIIQLITGLIYNGPGLVKNMCNMIEYGHEKN